jgi:hypothetical protein
MSYNENIDIIGGNMKLNVVLIHMIDVAARHF